MHQKNITIVQKKYHKWHNIVAQVESGEKNGMAIVKKISQLLFKKNITSGTTCVTSGGWY
jgi:hypothetical protein